MEKVWGKIHKSQHKEFWAATLIGDLNTMIDNFLHEYEGEVEKYDFIRGVHPLFVPALNLIFPKQQIGVGAISYAAPYSPFPKVHSR